MFDVCVCLCMVFACDVSGSVLVYQRKKPGYFSVGYNMIQVRVRVRDIRPIR